MYKDMAMQLEVTGPLTLGPRGGEAGLSPSLSHVLW